MEHDEDFYAGYDFDPADNVLPFYQRRTDERPAFSGERRLSQTIAPAHQVPAAKLDHDDDEAKAMAALNERHAVVRHGAGIMILCEDEDNGATFMSEAGFKSFMANQKVLINRNNAKGEPVTKLAPIVPLWLQHRDRRTYKGVTFAPGGDGAAGHYNLWQGFAIQPLEGTIGEAKAGCRKLLDHIEDNLCNGNAEHARYLMTWAADMVQDPGRKKGVALVMRGKKGTGKSIFVDALASLFGSHAIKIAQGKHLTGNFNRHLADKIFVVAEETYWAGDKGAEGALKDLITSDRITVEAKGVDAIEVPSLCRIAMVTNNEWAVPASADERRYFVLDVAETQMQNTAYFTAIVDELNNGGREALLTLLMKWNSGGLNLRDVPQTSALQEQKELSFEPLERFVFDLLSGAEYGGVSLDENAVHKQRVFDAYSEECRKRGYRNHFSFAFFCKRFMELTGATISKAARDESGYRAPTFKLPGLAKAQLTFATERNMPRLFRLDPPNLTAKLAE